MTIDIFTLFPEYFRSQLQTSLIGKAIQNKKVLIQVHNIRDYGVGKHQLTDDRPYGGGPGMVMRIEPIYDALKAFNYQKGTNQEFILLTSAKGHQFTQTTAREFAQLKRLAIICGHYEGVDERVADNLIDGEIRIGDFVLTGGEPAASVIVDAITRLQPEVLGNNDSIVGESHDTPGELGHAQYTRPETFQKWTVPKILQSGDHQAIAKFRSDQHSFESDKK